MVFAAPAAGYGQTASQGPLQKRVSLELNNASILDMLLQLKTKHGINYLFDMRKVTELPRITKSFKDVSVKQVLDECLKGTGLVYTVTNGVVVIRHRSQQGNITIKGTVTDEDGVPLRGVSVMLGSSKVGCATDARGNYTLTFPAAQDMVVKVSLIGYAPAEFGVDKSGNMNVKLRRKTQSMDEVVVGGVYTMKKETYTGSVHTIRGDELRKVSNLDVIRSIAALTPGMWVVENNLQGSNPNYVPEILIRGMNSLVTSDEERSLNTPLIILDGAEISIEELYNLDINDIERVDVFKDAAATVIYGNRAANGVIIVERKRSDPTKFKVRYSFTPSVRWAELSSLNLMNAEEKLEYERLAGLYSTTGNGSLDKAYAEKLMNIRRGVDTDWPRTPLRVSFSHNHSLTASGRGGGIEYIASTNFSDTYGVMKGDVLRSFATRFDLTYRTPFSLDVRYQVNYNYTFGKASPYGSFSQYTRMNPYEPIYDEFGELYKWYDFNPYADKNAGEINPYTQYNPLYNATLSSFSKSLSHNFRNTLSATYYFSRLFYLTGSANIRLGSSRADVFKSPDDTQFRLAETNKKGSYTVSGENNFDYNLKLSAHYTKLLNEEGTTAVSLQGGTELSQNRGDSYNVTYVEFYKDKLGSIDFANRYADGKPGGGADKIYRGANFNGFANFTLLGRYYTDVIFSMGASSEYGKFAKWSPNWSFGLGWSVHNEPWLANNDVITYLNLKATIGYNGLTGFDPYKALTWYQYRLAYMYYTGMGAVPISMGNPNLKWQKTLKKNLSLNIKLLDRISFTGEYYVNTTKNLIMPIDLPGSTGTSSTSINLGEYSNSGFEFSASGQIISNENFMWSVSLSGSHNFDRIEKISDALKKKAYEQAGVSEPKHYFREGGSQFDIYAVPSAGIDPATGQEIFIKKDGSYTFIHNADDIVAVGNTNPVLRGSVGSTFRYKRLSLTLTSTYEFGGDLYNSTLSDAVENVSGYQNADRRAFTDRWKAPGDVVRFLKIGTTKPNYESARFVQRNNVWNVSFVTLAYELQGGWLKKIGLSRLNLSLGVSDVIWLSTVKRERGIDYPYCRTYSIGIRPTF